MIIGAEAIASRVVRNDLPLPLDPSLKLLTDIIAILFGDRAAGYGRHQP